MTDQEDAKPKGPQNLEGALHELKNCLSVARSGCVLIEAALAQGQTEEAQAVVTQMREALSSAANLTRGIPVFVTAERDE